LDDKLKPPPLPSSPPFAAAALAGAFVSAFFFQGLDSRSEKSCVTKASVSSCRKADSSFMQFSRSSSLGTSFSTSTIT